MIKNSFCGCKDSANFRINNHSMIKKYITSKKQRQSRDIITQQIGIFSIICCNFAHKYKEIYAKHS